MITWGAKIKDFRFFFLLNLFFFSEKKGLGYPRPVRLNKKRELYSFIKDFYRKKFTLFFRNLNLCNKIKNTKRQKILKLWYYLE